MLKRERVFTFLAHKNQKKKLKQTLKNTKCEGVKVHQLLTFFTSVITLNN